MKLFDKCPACGYMRLPGDGPDECMCDEEWGGPWEDLFEMATGIPKCLIESRTQDVPGMSNVPETVPEQGT